MDEGKVMVENKPEAKRLHEAEKDRPSALGLVRKKLRRIMNRKKKDLEIYPLF
jgi:hypothetical protein